MTMAGAIAGVEVVGRDGDPKATSRLEVTGVSPLGVFNRSATGGSSTKRGNRRKYMYDHAERLCLGFLDFAVEFDAVSPGSEE
jgi:hypothetical protein